MFVLMDERPPGLNKNSLGQPEAIQKLIISSQLFEFGLVGNRQFMTPLCPARSQYLAAIGGLHPLTETMDRFTAPSVRLKCTLHE
jgi:hypothetical protein